MNPSSLSPADRVTQQARDQADFQTQLWSERVRMLCVHVPIVMMMAVGFALSLGWLLHEQVAPAGTNWWFGVRLVVVLVRVVHARYYMRSADKANRAWYQSFLALVMLEGLLWGAASLVPSA